MPSLSEPRDEISGSASIVPGPIVIGGIGGSGTRVVASLLMEMGCFLGNDLNHPLDNLTYTFLFKRPAWYYRHRTDREKMITGLRILEKYMLGKGSYSITEHAFLLQALFSMYRHGHNHYHDGAGKWALERYRRIVFGRPDRQKSMARWGWKEPNTHLLLESLDEYFGDLKYICLVRNGLDMAFSDNQQQLFNWGPLYGVMLPADPGAIPAAAFRYWIEATKRALETGKRMGSSRFLCINYEKLCESPGIVIPEIAKFTGVTPDEALLDKLTGIPRLPASSGRYRDHDLPFVTESDYEFLRGLGFETRLT